MNNREKIYLNYKGVFDLKKASVIRKRKERISKLIPEYIDLGTGLIPCYSQVVLPKRYKLYPIRNHNVKWKEIKPF